MTTPEEEAFLELLEDVGRTLAQRGLGSLPTDLEPYILELEEGGLL